MKITQALLNTVFTGYNTAFQMRFAAVTPLWRRVAMEVPSSTASETYGWLGQMPRIREWIGDRVVNKLDTYDYQIKNRTFESTFTLKRDDVEDDRFGILTPAAGALGQSAAEFPDELVFLEAMANGWSRNCFDGQYFFDTDHPVLDANGKPQPVSNMQAGAGPGWYMLDTSKSVMPFILQSRRKFEFVNKTDPQNSDVVFMKGEFIYGTDGRLNAGYGFWQLAFGSKAALNQANFRAARLAMSSLTADMGKPLGIRPNLLVVPAALEDAAKDLIAVDRMANGASNPEYKAMEILVVPWLPNV